MQLNLNELPTSLFYERWRKNLSEKELINNYIRLYSNTITTLQESSTTLQESTTTLSNDNQDYQYILDYYKKYNDL
jgi:hypothetical protein